MKNRNIPFGYQYQNGKIEIHTYESKILSDIINIYLGGSSLSKIAQQLNDAQIEYANGITGWNKARLMRIIQDKRYLGTNTYPQIISEDTHRKLLELKSEKNTQKYSDHSTNIFNIDVPVICPSCGCEMNRRHDKRRKCSERWICKCCKTNIAIPDNDFIDEIMDLMNMVIGNPGLIKNTEPVENEPSTEVRKLENEIGRLLEGVKFDKEFLREKMFECVSLKYTDIDTKLHIYKRLRADFEKSGPLDSFSPDLFARTVRAITIGTDKTVGIILINGQ